MHNIIVKYLLLHDLPNGTFDNTFVAPTGSTGQGSTAEVITLSNNSIFVGSTPIISGSLGKLNNVGSLLNC